LAAQNRVTMLWEFRDPLNGWSWRLPWGYQNKHEKPESAALRELAEEAGLKARHLKKIFVRLPEGKNQNRVHAFLATGLSSVKANPEAHEKIKTKKIHLARAAKMALAGKINEPVISMLILRVARLHKIL
jgi:8-oxo-dGTP pyrophosphatase MutT (NUDIX family)